MKKKAAFLLVTIAGLFFSGTASALINGDFEVGDLTGWEVAGEARAISSIASAAVQVVGADGHLKYIKALGGQVDVGTLNFLGQGAYQALVSTDFFIDNMLAVSPSEIESFLSLPSGSLASLSTGNPFEGSAIKQSFFANQGDVLTFDWNFETGLFPGPASNAVNDFAFFSLGNDLNTLVDSQYPLFFRVNNGFELGTGYQTFSYSIPTTGQYTLGLGVLDVGHGNANSGLFLDQFKILSNSSSGGSGTNVPEPFGLGVAAIVFGVTLARRRKIKTVKA